VSGAALPATEGLEAAASRADAAAAEPSDTALLGRARAGDRTAFGTLVERHQRTLAAVLRQRAGRDLPLDDLLQEVFARTLANLGGFRHRSSYLTWATAIGLNLATDWRRKQARRARLAPRAEVEGDEVPCPDSEPAQQVLERRDEARRASEALDALPLRLRLAVTLRVVEDLPYETVAERLGAPVPRVRTWVSRGLKRLRRDLEKESRP